MKVICKGHKTCNNIKHCSHANMHEWNNKCEQEYHYPDDCKCSNKYLRTEKLENLEKLNESNL